MLFHYCVPHPKCFNKNSIALTLKIFGKTLAFLHVLLKIREIYCWLLIYCKCIKVTEFSRCSVAGVQNVFLSYATSRFCCHPQNLCVNKTSHWVWHKARFSYKTGPFEVWPSFHTKLATNSEQHTGHEFGTTHRSLCTHIKSKEISSSPPPLGF